MLHTSKAFRDNTGAVGCELASTLLSGRERKRNETIPTYLFTYITFLLKFTYKEINFLFFGSSWLLLVIYCQIHEAEYLRTHNIRTNEGNIMRTTPNDFPLRIIGKGSKIFLQIEPNGTRRNDILLPCFAFLSAGIDSRVGASAVDICTCCQNR